MMAGTYFLRLSCKIFWDPWAHQPCFYTDSFHIRVGFPAVQVAQHEPGSSVFGLSGCHVEPGAQAVLPELSRLTHLPVAGLTAGQHLREKLSVHSSLSWRFL